MIVSEERCIELGLDPKKVESIARRIGRAVKEANAMGLYLFAGNSTGRLVVNQNHFEDKPELLVAELDGDMDGGVGDDIVQFD